MRGREGGREGGRVSDGSGRREGGRKIEANTLFSSLRIKRLTCRMEMGEEEEEGPLRWREGRKEGGREEGREGGQLTFMSMYDFSVKQCSGKRERA